jgi:polyphosphate kinase 2 (PPK2 family)
MMQIKQIIQDFTETIIMNFRSQERQLAAYKMELAKVQKELATVKENLNIVFQGFGNLQKFIE